MIETLSWNRVTDYQLRTEGPDRVVYAIYRGERGWTLQIRDPVDPGIDRAHFGTLKASKLAAENDAARHRRLAFRR